MDTTKEMLMDAVKGCSPRLDQLITFNEFGFYSGSYGTWEWNESKLLSLSREQLQDLYRILKRKP